MRLGGPIKADNPDQWAKETRAAGYRASFCPVPIDADDATVAAYLDAAKAADIVIAEVGAWSNPISPNDEERAAAMEKCIKSLAHADRLGACCCVNIVGSRSGERWAAPHPENLSRETFDMVVECTRTIIDAVKPTRTVYALETMPWIIPDSPDSYLELIDAIDRKGVGVHLDPVNMINCPARYYDTTGFLKECFAKLGDRIVSCHAKDIKLQDKLTVHLDEVVIGEGGLDYVTFLKELDKLNPDIPLMLEHLPFEQYPTAAKSLRAYAKQAGVPL